MSNTNRAPRVEAGQLWADPSSGQRIVRIVKTDSVASVPSGARTQVETVTPAAPGGRTGQRTNVLTVNIPSRFRLVQNADGSPA